MGLKAHASTAMNLRPSAVRSWIWVGDTGGARPCKHPAILFL